MTWHDLSDGELRARLEQRATARGMEIADVDQLVRRREYDDEERIIGRIIGDDS